MEKKYYCHFELALDIVGGKWKPLILYFLGKHEVLRYTELKNLMPRANERVISRQLKDLIEKKLIEKIDYNQFPLKVEYSLSPLGKEVFPILNDLKKFGKLYNEEFKNLKVKKVEVEKKQN